MASFFFTKFKVNVADKVFNLGSDTLNAMLVTVAPTSTVQNTGNSYADVTNEVANGNGYTTGGVALASTAVAADNTNTRMTLSGNNASWTSATFSAVGAVLYDASSASPANGLICYVDFGGTQTVTNGTFTVKWNGGASNGIIATFT